MPRSIADNILEKVNISNHIRLVHQLHFGRIKFSIADGATGAVAGHIEVKDRFLSKRVHL